MRHVNPFSSPWLWRGVIMKISLGNCFFGNLIYLWVWEAGSSLRLNVSWLCRRKVCRQHSFVSMSDSAGGWNRDLLAQTARHGREGKEEKCTACKESRVESSKRLTNSQTVLQVYKLEPDGKQRRAFKRDVEKCDKRKTNFDVGKIAIFFTVQWQRRLAELRAEKHIIKSNEKNSLTGNETSLIYTLCWTLLLWKFCHSFSFSSSRWRKSIRKISFRKLSGNSKRFQEF